MSGVRLRSAVARLTTLPDDCLAVALSFLDASDLTRCSRACRLLYRVIDTRHLVWEAALFSLDPFADLGPAAFVAAARAGRGCLELARRLGDPACLCGRKPTLKFSKKKIRFVCVRCIGEESYDFLPEIFSRYVFFRQPTVQVKNEVELRAAMQVISDRRECESYPLTTILVTADIDLSDLLFLRELRVKGLNRDITLSHDDGPVIMGRNFVVESLTLNSGTEADIDEDSDIIEQQNFPAVEHIKLIYEDSLYAALQLESKKTGEPHRSGGSVVISDCEIDGMQGSAIMIDSASASIVRCDITSSMFYGIICKTDEAREQDPGFLASVRGCTFAKSLWHISAGPDLSDADEAALLAENVFHHEKEYIHSDNVTRAEASKKWVRGKVQPWRRGCLLATGRHGAGP